MGLNKNSAGGPDGMSGAFFQDTWDIINLDIQNMVEAFYCGHTLPRFIAHTNLVLLKKTCGEFIFRFEAYLIEQFC